MDVNDWLSKNIIFEAIMGSHAYGLNTETSDEDFRGVCIAPKCYYYGLREFEQTETKDPDRTVFNITKFFKLAADCNPNIIEFLYAPEDCILSSSKIWEDIVDKREIFLSKKAKFTYQGYAFSQLKRVKSHKAWLLNPVDKKPERSDFGLSTEKKMSAEYMGYIESIAVTQMGKGTDKQEIMNGNIDISNMDLGLDKSIVKLYDSERKYRCAKNQYDQYQNWKASRNPARADLEAKFGYDTKHISHVFRLLIQAESILDKHLLKVRLDPADREFCRSIRAGAYTYDKVLEMADEQMSKLDSLYESSTLRKAVSLDEIDNLLVNSISNFHGGTDEFVKIIKRKSTTQG